jgi:hypothetical protein
MAIITVNDLEAFMGKTFTEDEAVQAEAIIDTVEIFIEEVTGLSFTHIPSDTIRIQADGHGIIELASKPVNDVGPIFNMKGDEILEWEFDGLSAVYNFFPNQVVDLTYDHGYETPPKGARVVALGMASRVLYNPAGLRQETVGAISVTYPGIGGEAGTINLSSLEKKILDDLGRTSYSMRTAVTQKRVGYMPILTLNNDID